MNTASNIGIISGLKREIDVEVRSQEKIRGKSHALADIYFWYEVFEALRPSRAHDAILLANAAYGEAEASRKRLSITDQVFLFQQNQLSSFFNRKAADRLHERMVASRNSWRYR